MNKQQGFVSIITVSIIMIIVTLIVIGFSQIMQREQRQALDRQLSSQAVYAAETAVNDVYALLQAGGTLPDEKPDCNVEDWPTPGANGRVNSGSANEAAYTCLTFDQTPPYLEFTNGSINTQQSKIFPIRPKGNSNVKVSEITFKWNGASGVKNLSLDQNCNYNLPPTVTPPGVPILRVDLVRLPSTGAVVRDDVINETATFFLYPVNSCGNNSRPYDSLLVSVADKGTIIPVNCNPALAYACTYTLANINRGSGGDVFYARVKSIYNDADLRVEGRQTQSPGGILNFVGAQVTVDATGKSNDVLRRIKVQLANPSYPIPEFVMQGMDEICKDITIIPPSTVTNSCLP